MRAWSQTGWNTLVALLLLLGASFILMTRVQSAQGSVAPFGSTAIQPDPAPQPYHPAPLFGLYDLNGTVVNLSDLKGKVVLINTWATWCPPCRAEMPMIQAAYEQYRDQGFVVLAVDLEEDPRTVGAFMQQFGLMFPALLDRDGQVNATYRATVLPSSFFVDRQGVVRAVYRGPMARSVITGTVDQLLAEGQ